MAALAFSMTMSSLSSLMRRSFEAIGIAMVSLFFVAEVVGP